MSVLGIVMSIFPVFQMAAIAGALYQCLTRSDVASFALLLFLVYLFPLLCFRVHQRFWPLKEGVSHLIGNDYSPWYGSHQLQLLLIACPFLETVLRLIPGAFSLWLSAWGSQVGRGVYWTPAVEILDRSLLSIGDRAVFGHRCGMSAHIITPRKGNLTLFVARIEIGVGVFLGAGTYVGPGGVIEAGAVVRAGQHVYPNTRVAASGAKTHPSADEES